MLKLTRVLKRVCHDCSVAPDYGVGNNFVMYVALGKMDRLLADICYDLCLYYYDDVGNNIQHNVDIIMHYFFNNHLHLYSPKTRPSFIT